MKRRTSVTVSTPSVVGLSGCLGDTERRITDTAVETPLERFSLSVNLAIADAAIGHPTALTLSLENAADDPIRVRNYGVWPLGMLALTPPLTSGEDTQRTTLLSPSCEANTRVEVGRGGSSLSLDGMPITRLLDTGESVSGRYELHDGDLSGSGMQCVVNRFERKAPRYVTGNGWGALDYQLRLSINKRRRFPFQLRGNHSAVRLRRVPRKGSHMDIRGVYTDDTILQFPRPYHYQPIFYE